MDLLTWIVGAFLASLLVGGAGLGLSPAPPAPPAPPSPPSPSVPS